MFCTQREEAGKVRVQRVRGLGLRQLESRKCVRACACTRSGGGGVRVCTGQREIVQKLSRKLPLSHHKKKKILRLTTLAETVAFLRPRASRRGPMTVLPPGTCAEVMRDPSGPRRLRARISSCSPSPSRARWAAASWKPCIKGGGERAWLLHRPSEESHREHPF